MYARDETKETKRKLTEKSSRKRRKEEELKNTRPGLRRIMWRGCKGDVYNMIKR